MKNIFKTIAFLLIISLSLSCSKELEYGSDYDFKINNIDNSTIVASLEKTFSIEVIKQFNKTKSKNFTFSYSGANIEIINDNIPLLQNNPYPFTLDEMNKINLKLIPKTKGDLTLTVNLTDDFGLSREKKIIVKVIEDLNFDFKATNPKPLYEDIITSSFDLFMQLTNIGTGTDTYKIKAFSSLTGNIKINNNLGVQNELNPILQGNITASFTPDMLGEQTVTFIIVNSKNVEKEVTYKLKVNPKVFSVTPIASLETKQTLSKNFTFTLSNTIPNWKYKVKFQSNTGAKISTTNGLLLALNTYTDLALNTKNFTYVYNSDAIGSDVITITVTDEYNQVISSSINVTVTSKPTISKVDAKVYKTGDLLNAFYKIQGDQAFGGATITEYEFKILNYATNNFDTFNLKESAFSTLYDLEGFNRARYVFYFSGGAHIQVTKEDRTINYYWNQPYTVRVKDSDGVWSDTIGGTMTY